MDYNDLNAGTTLHPGLRGNTIGQTTTRGNVSQGANQLQPQPSEPALHDIIMRLDSANEWLAGMEERLVSFANRVSGTIPSDTSLTEALIGDDLISAINGRLERLHAIATGINDATIRIERIG